MKAIALFGLLIWIATFNALAQTQIKRDSLSQSQVLNYNDSTTFNATELRFKSVISDSRCPKNVTCVWAGEARVLVSIYKNDQFIKDLELVFDASGYVLEEFHTLLIEDTYKVFAFGLAPYPDDAAVKIPENAYKLELLMQPNKI